MPFPAERPRRLRQSPWVRDLVQEHRVTAADLILPLFVQEGEGRRTPVSSMPGVARWSVDLLVGQVREAAALGIPAVALFPVVDGSRKTPDGDEATNPDNLICRALSALRDAALPVAVIADVALDPFTTHGQDGVLRGDKVDNDASLEVLVRQAVVQAQAGATVIAPSDMMDGRIGAIRHALDEAGQQDTLILSYAAKYASAFYGPFRDALDSKGNLGAGDKRTYQMDPANGSEALREVALDLEEGADMVMVKPGMPYLDIVRRVREQFSVPTFAYQVSGEYAMLQAAGQQGWLDYPAALMESLLAFKRAGCDAVLSYGALDAAQWLVRGS